MASPSLASILTSSSYCPTLTSPSSSAPTLTSFNVNSRACPKITEHLHQQSQRSSRGLSVKALTLDFSGSFFEGGVEDDEPPGSSISLLDGKEEPQCPPGLRQYETMAVLRPDMSEDERLNLTQKYEELLVAGGGMYVEVFNRGVIPLAYSIKKKNTAGESNTYLDGIYLLFTYFTKPESIAALEERLKADDDVIRSCTFKIRKRKN
ncbi:PREDICTED: 30S ribosomal protein S6 alpha, chloroplastic-like [Nelumbo nucifera]|uniref:30S ribosomal protein S6 alpha, chloroplastic-like n=1 Tax=Nelumbo nucifera TaxID=4432 RepID=A0A1U8AJX4_NELNU|nr:PREDICTED: 30S ribosomal protein S6 alpha, chloroplastic-like [Nelumbo nucifera]